MAKGLDDCRGASKGVWGSVGWWGCDSTPPLGPEPLRVIVHVDLAWTCQGVEQHASIVCLIQ